MDGDAAGASLFGGNGNDHAYSVTTEEIAAFKVRIKLAFTLFDLSGNNVINKRDMGTLIRYLGYFPSEQDMKQMVLPQLNELLKQNRSALNMNVNLNEDLKVKVNDADTESDAKPKATKLKEAPPQNENEIDFATFELIMLAIMKQNLFPSDDEETLLSAFKVIQKHFKSKRRRPNASSSGSEQSEDEDDENDEDDDDDEKKVLFKNDIICAMQDFGDDFRLDSRELDEFLSIAIITTNKNNKKINQKAAKHKAKDVDAQANEIIYYEDYVDELYFQLTNHA